MAEPFILLLKIGKNPDRAMNDKIGKVSTTPIRVLMFGDTMLAVGVTFDGNAGSLWKAMARVDIQGLIEMLIVQPTEDWCGGREKPGTGWMFNHCGNPAFWGSSG